MTNPNFLLFSSEEKHGILDLMGSSFAFPIICDKFHVCRKFLTLSVVFTVWYWHVTSCSIPVMSSDKFIISQSPDENLTKIDLQCEITAVYIRWITHGILEISFICRTPERLFIKRIGVPYFTNISESPHFYLICSPKNLCTCSQIRSHF